MEGHLQLFFEGEWHASYLNSDGSKILAYLEFQSGEENVLTFTISPTTQIRETNQILEFEIVNTQTEEGSSSPTIWKLRTRNTKLKLEWIKYFTSLKRKLNCSDYSSSIEMESSYSLNCCASNIKNPLIEEMNEIEKHQLIENFINFHEVDDAPAIANQISLKLISEIGGGITNLVQSFSKTTTCSEVISAALQKIPGAENAEDFGVFLETSRDSFWLDPLKTLEDYAPLFSRPITSCYIKKKDSFSSHYFSTELISEDILVVLITHTRFITSIDLLQLLLKKHFDFSSEGTTESAKLKRKIERIIEYWIGLFPDDFSDLSMKILLSNWKCTSSLLSKIHFGLVPRKNSLPCDILLPKTQMLKCKKLIESPRNMEESIYILLRDAPHYLAQQLTWIDFDNFTRLTKKDLIQFVLNPSNAVHIIQIIRDDYNKMIQWVATTIVIHVQKGNAKRIFENFIYLAFLFVKLNNINGLMKVYTALTLPFIARIFVYYFQKFKEERKSMWTIIEREVKLHTDVAFKSYFTRKNTSCLRPAQPFLPCFYLLFQQIENIELNCPNPIHPSKVNIRKLELLAHLLDDILKHRIGFDIESDSKLIQFFREKVEVKSNSDLVDILNSTQEGIKASKINSELSHSWDWRSFRKIHVCLFCNRHLWGVRHQGLQCKVCRIIAHQSCSSKLDQITPCNHELISLLEVQEQSASFTKKYFSNNPYTFKRSFKISDNQKREIDLMIKDNAIDKLICFLQNGKFSLNFVLSQGLTLFHIAASMNSISLLKCILKHIEEKPDIDSFDDNGRTALHIACSEAYLGIINLLLESGAKLNRPNLQGCTPLSLLVRNIPSDSASYQKLLRKFLLNGACVNCYDENYFTPFHYAVLTGNNSAIEILLPFANLNALTLDHKRPIDISVSKKEIQLTSLLSKAMQKAEEIPSEFVLKDKGWKVSLGDPLANYEIESNHLCIKLQNDLYFSKYYFDKVHADLIGIDPEHGIGLVSLLQKESSTGRILIRTKNGDNLIALPEINSCDKILQNMKTLTQIDYKLIPESEAYVQILRKAEHKMIIRDFQFDVIYIKKGQYLFDNIINNRETDHSQQFIDFLDFLGSKTPSSRIAPVSSASPGTPEYSITTKFKKFTFIFNISTMMFSPKSFGNLVTIVFLESSCLDLSIFTPLGANIIFVVQPIYNETSFYYQITLCYKNNIHEFEPSFPYQYYFEPTKQFRSFFLTKLANSWAVGKSNSLKAEEIDARNKALLELSDKLKMEKSGLHTPKKKDLLQFTVDEEEQRLQYTLEGSLGNGLTGTVFKATHSITGETYAVKIITKDQITSAHMLNAVKGEVKLMSKCNHPNIVKAYEMYDLDDKIFIILELYTGGTLDEDVKRNPYSEKQAAHVCYQILDAVNYMHKKFISHRDLKPSNIMYSTTKRDRIKIIDFGFGKDVVEDPLGYTIVGTQNFMAPEVLTASNYDYFKIDIYSCGCIVHYLFFGTTPKFSPQQTIIFSDPTVLSDIAKEFINSLCALDWTQRISSEEAIASSWFDILNIKK